MKKAAIIVAVVALLAWAVYELTPLLVIWWMIAGKR